MEEDQYLSGGTSQKPILHHCDSEFLCCGQRIPSLGGQEKVTSTHRVSVPPPEDMGQCQDKVCQNVTRYGDGQYLNEK